MIDQSDFEKHYRGIICTPSLWHGNTVIGLSQYELDTCIYKLKINPQKSLRLGKLVERFICFQLEQDPTIELLVENYQVQNDTLTIGELDCLFLKDKKPIHLEIIYKFYLYDETVGDYEIDYWIGPNRKDSLKQKLDKLDNKQLPLLYNKHTKPLLDELNIKPQSIEQKVCFKAQLFIPYNKTEINYNQINKECVIGFYLNKEQLNDFKDCKFYVLKKIDWLLEVHTNVDWKSYKDFIEHLYPILNNKTSPMIWIKKPNGELLKCFVVWW